MKRTVTILGGDERMAWLAESLRREGYIIRLAALLPPAPLKNRLPQPETPDRLLPESETVILAVPTVGPDGMLRTPTVPECYPLAECLRLLPERAMVLGGTLPPDCRKIVEERHLAYTDLLALPELQELNAIATAEGAVALAMREQNTTLFDTRCVVLGYGRCGSALCRRLAALGAKVTAAARRREQLARIYADGHTPCDINKLSPALDGCKSFLIQCRPRYCRRSCCAGCRRKLWWWSWPARRAAVTPPWRKRWGCATGTRRACRARQRPAPPENTWGR